MKKFNNMIVRVSRMVLALLMAVSFLAVPSSAVDINSSGTLNDATTAGILNWDKLDFSWQNKSDGNTENGSGSCTLATGGAITMKATGYTVAYVFSNSTTTTLTITNKSTTLDAYVTLSYTKTAGNDPTFSLSGTDGVYTIPENGSLVITLTSPSGSNNSSSGTLTISSIEMETTSTTVNFQTAVGGSYTISGGKEGVEETAGNSYDKTTDDPAYTLTAEAAEGYEFFGWISTTDGLLSQEPVYSGYNPIVNDTIYPFFYDKNSAVYHIQGTTAGYYGYFDEAMSAAVASSGVVELLTSGTVMGKPDSSGSSATAFEIPSNVSFLIPYGEGDTGNFTDTVSYYNKGKVGSAYSNGTLTLPAGSSITVNGKMNINALHREIDDDSFGSVTGTYGHLILADDAKLIVENGGALYCYGYITGGGSVTAQSGAAVYEPIQIADWRGGSRMSTWLLLGSGTGKDALGFSQYYIQNIESVFTLYSGAELYVSGHVVMNSSDTPFQTKIVGESSLISMSGGCVVMRYAPYDDRMTYEVYGTGSLGKMSITMAGSTVDTSKYIAPLNSNMTIVIKEGSNFTALYDYKLLPDAEIYVEENANLTVNGDLYLYGVTAWTDGAYADGNDSIALSYIATTGAKSTRAVTATGSSSAKLQVDGTLTVASAGGIYTTGTADETSKTDGDKVIYGKGTIVNGSTCSNTSIYELKNTTDALLGTPSVEKVSISVQPAVGRLAGKSTSDADYANFGTGTYYGLGEELNHYWYQKAVSVTGGVSEIVNMQGSVVKVNNGTATAYSVTGGTVRLALADGYAASQNGAFLASSVDSDAVCVVYETTDLGTEIVIGTAEMVNVTVNMVCDGKIGRTLELSVPSGTTLSGYYTDLACTTAATTVTGGEVLYAYALAWVEWASGTPDIYYKTLDEAMTAAVNSGDTVHLLGDILVDTPYTITADRNLVFSLDGHTITYNSTLFDIYGKLTLDLAGGKIINYYNPSPSATDTTDSDGNTVTTYDTAAAEVCALKTQSGGVLNLTVNGGSLGWAVPASYITDYGYSFGSTSYVTPLYNYAGGTVNIDLTSGEIYTDHPGVLSYSAGTYKLPAISNRGTMTITGNGDGEGVIWSSAYNNATGYANTDGTTCYVTVTLHNYGSSADLTLNGVTVNSTSTDAEYISAIYSYNGSAMTLCNTIINANKGYAIYNRGAKITEITDCTINCRSGIYSYKNSNYSASIGSIGGQTTITASGSYGIYNRATIGTIGGENANVSITGSLYGIYLYADQEIGQIGGKNATINISQTSAGASNKYYSPIYLGSGAHIGTIGVDKTVTGNTETTVTLTASAYYGIYAAGDIDTIGGERAEITIVGSQHGIYLDAGCTIEEIGGKNATINISQTSAGASSTYYSPIYLGSGAHIGTIGVDETVTGNTETTVTLTASAYYGIYAAGGIDTIGGENANVSISGTLYGIYLCAGQEIGQIGGKNATINISQSTSSGSSKYYAPIRLGAGAHIGTIGVDETVTGNTKTTVTLTASYYYGIYSAGTIDAIGGPQAEITITAPRYAVRLTSGGSVGTIGTGNDTVTLESTSSGSYYGLYLEASSSVGTIGGGNSSNVTIQGVTRSCYVVAGAEITTIGTEGSTVTFKTTSTASNNRSNLYVYGSVGTIGGAGSTVSFSGARGYSSAGYGIYVEGSVGLIGDTNSTITLSGTSRNTTNYYRGIYVTGGGTVTQIGSTGAAISITETNSTKYGHGIWVAYGTIDSIGNGAAITITTYNGIAAGSTIAEYAGTITTLGSDTGSIKITASNAGIYTYRNYSGTGTIETIGGNVQVSSSKYGIYNNGVIDMMADGLVLVTTGGTSYYTVYNSEATTTTVTEPTTDEEGNEVSTEVVYDVPAGSITKVSGGEYYHQSGRDYIFSDGVDKVNYEGGKTLSSNTQSVTLFTNKAYNCYYITCGHTNTGKKVENQVNPTCTENGSYDSVVYCTDCEAEVSRETVTLSAIGHSYEAVVTEPTCQTAGYTTYTCSACADRYTDNYVASSDDYHNYVNGVCNVCEGRQGSETSVKFKIYATNIAVGDALDLYFYVRASDLGDSTDYYAVLERTYADGTTVTKKVPFTDWEMYSDTLYRFCYSDIAAKEMTDGIKATVYYTGGTEASESYTETVRSYALRLLETLGGSKTAQSRALVDMLNYGAACQTYFGYNTDSLANAGAKNYQSYATTGATCESNLVPDDNGNLFAVSVSAKNSLMFTFYFKNINEKMTAKVSYTDHHGVPHTLTLSGDTFYDLNNDGSVFGVDVTGVSFASGRSVLKCEVYDGDKLVASASDSVEGYIARQGDSRADVYTKLLYFIDSTYDLFA